MNRTLTEHFFREQVQEGRYPTWQEKKQLAVRILEEFPQFARDRPSQDAPNEYLFFWRYGGKKMGTHTGVIETRVGNMRKDVPPEDRKFRRIKKAKLSEVHEDIIETAASLAALTPSTQNGRTISEGMAHCHIYYEWIMSQTGNDHCHQLLLAFPHLLNFEGVMIQQCFERIFTTYNKQANPKQTWCAALMLDNKSWSMVEDENIRGILRVMKKLTNRGVSRKAEEGLLIEENQATPLIRWLKPDAEVPEIESVERHCLETSYLPSHILCAAEVFKKGNLYIVTNGKTIPCGSCTNQAIDVFLKHFSVLGLNVPVLLRKLLHFVSIHIWNTEKASKSTQVVKLCEKFQEFQKSMD